MNKDVTKAAQLAKSGKPDEDDLALINAFALEPLTADQVFTFAVKLCDNEVDRDLERFSEDTLDQLAKLFVGKTGIFDHNWTAKGQTARIYKTEVVEDESQTTKAGKPYRYLKAWAYMVKTDTNTDLITQIQGGILKEVSVGCSVARSVCSVCGDETYGCGHRKGETYDGELCYRTLVDAVDAYEWSFVAVPAQPAAGITKGMEKAGENGQDPGGEDAALREKKLQLATKRQELFNIIFGGK